MTSQKIDAQLSRYRTNLESHEYRTSERPANRSRFSRSKVVQLTASAVPPNLTRNLEAKSESQKYQIQSLQRDPQTSQDSLHNWAKPTTIRTRVSVLKKVLLHRHLANKYVLKREKLGPALGVIQTGHKISEIQTLQHSRTDLSNGL